MIPLLKPVARSQNSRSGLAILASEVGFPIRKSTDQSLFAAPHGLSQRTTSFIASCHQGIHQMPLSRLIALIINARSAAETLIRKDQIMRDKPNSSAVGAACLAATPGEASGISPLHDVKIEDRKPSPASNCVLYPLRKATSADDCRRNWWSQTGSNRRPQACKASALPTELWPRSHPDNTHRKRWWAWVELNYRPHAYQACALTT